MNDGWDVDDLEYPLLIPEHRRNTTRPGHPEPSISTPWEGGGRRTHGHAEWPQGAPPEPDGHQRFT